MFTGDLVETGQFAIFPSFPPYDVDVSGTHWVAVMERLAAQGPRVVVPGHNDIDGPQLLSDVGDYLKLLRDETWRRRDSAMSEDTIAEEVTDLMIKRHPDWDGRAAKQPGRLKDVATVQLRSSFLTPGGGMGTTENFVRIGHSLFALIVGWLGGALSRKFRPSH